MKCLRPRPRRRGGKLSRSQRRDWIPRLPLFPVGPFTPGSKCPHRGPLRDTLFVILQALLVVFSGASVASLRHAITKSSQ